MNKTIIITEDISDPIDEGIKKFSFYLAKFVSESDKDNLIFSNSINKKLPGILPLPGNKLLFSFSFLKKIANYNPRTLIYVPFSSSTLMSFIRVSVMKTFCRKAKIIMVSVQKRNHNNFSKKLIKLLKPDELIVLSRKEAIYYKDLGFNCKVSPIGVEAEKYTEINAYEKKQLRLKLNLPPNDKIILHVGHLNKGRNLEVMKSLVSKGFRVLIITSTRFKADEGFKAYLEKAGVVFVTSYIEKIEEYYQASDIYVFPVLSAFNAMEFPMSVLEAMACNIPVITTRFGGIETFLQETDWFKYFADEDELIAKANSFPQNDVCDNRQMVLSKFSWKNVFNNLFENNSNV